MVALPMLEAMAPSVARAQAAAPKRMLAYYVPCGIVMNAWTPAATGASWALTPILTPLAPVKDDVLVLSGLANRPARPDGPGDHASGTGAFLTASHPFKTEGANIRNGISVDQVAANAIGAATLFPSLQLGIDGGSGVGDCDSGYSCAYARNISWASPTQPLPKITSPAVLYDQLFQGFDPDATAEEQARRTLYRTSVLDFVRDEANSLKLRLGTTDRAKLDQYLTGVDELEDKIAKASTGPVCEPIDRPSDPGDIVAHSDIMNRLMTLAFQCDATRVISFMLANAGSNRSYEFLGVSGGHHEISHHQDLQENFDRLHRDRHLGGAAAREPAGDARRRRGRRRRHAARQLARVLLERDLRRQRAQPHRHAHPAGGQRRGRDPDRPSHRLRRRVGGEAVHHHAQRGRRGDRRVRRRHRRPNTLTCPLTSGARCGRAAGGARSISGT
jgi:hypothetical protein